MRRAGVAAAVLAGVLALAACGTTEAHVRAVGDVSPAAAQPGTRGLLTLAATTTASVATGRMEMTVTSREGDVSFAMSGTGEFDNSRKRSHSVLDVSSALQSGSDTDAQVLRALFPGGNVETATDGGTVYVKLPLLASLAGDSSKAWVSIDIAQFTGLDLADLDTGVGDLHRYLDLLNSSGASVQNVGHEQVHGVDTTHYSASVTFAGMLKTLPKASADQAAKVLNGRVDMNEPMPYDVWVDSDNLVRRIAYGYDMSVDDGSGRSVSVSLKITTTLFDLGKPVDVAVPSAADAIAIPGPLLDQLRQAAEASSPTTTAARQG